MQRWPEEHLKILHDRYPTNGTNIPELLQHYTVSLIKTKARSLKLSCDKFEKVTFQGKPASMRQVLMYYHVSKRCVTNAEGAGISRQELVDRFQIMHMEVDGALCRTVSSFVLPRSAYFEYNGFLWTPKCYVDLYHPEWTVDSFVNARQIHGFSADEAFSYLSSNRLDPSWSDEENKILVENQNLPLDQLAPLLPGRSEGAIRAHAKKCGIRVFQYNGGIGLSKANQEIEVASFAYIGTDGLTYYFAKCAVCRRALLLPTTRAMEFRHSDSICSELSVPSDMNIPWDVRRIT